MYNYLKKALYLSIIGLNMNLPSFATINIQEMNLETINHLDINSWENRRFNDVVKQSLDKSCGAAATATILKYFYQLEINEESILKIMGKSNELTSFKDLSEAVNKYDFTSKGYHVGYEQLKKLKIPAIVQVFGEDTVPHFVVLKYINNDEVHIADPMQGNVVMNKRQFLDLWTLNINKETKGQVLLIIPNNKSIKTNHKFLADNDNLNYSYRMWSWDK